MNPYGNSSGNANSTSASISADGRYVAFMSSASNLVSGDTNGQQDVFVRDRVLGTTTLLSKSDSGTLGSAGSYPPSISCDGGYVTFASSASNLVSGDTNGHKDIFLVKRAGGDSIKDITLSANSYDFGNPKISCDGSTIAMSSDSSNLVTGDTNSLPDTFVYNIYDSTFQRINVSSSGAQAASYSGGAYDLSFNGRYVTFSTQDPGMVSGDTNGYNDVFVRDRQSGTTEILSKRNTSTQTSQVSDGPAITQDGKYVAYLSRDTGLISTDTNGVEDAFLSQTGY